jgi:radical SAM superfamily enzyme YgiQ (UPF0313 family)
MKGLRQKVRDMKRGLAPPSTDLSGARVTLVEPPFILPHNFIDYPLFMNLGLLHNAALLERMGAEVSVFDAVFSADGLLFERGKETDWLGMSVDALVDRTRSQPADLIVLHASFFANPRYLEKTTLPKLCAALKNAHPGVPVILADMFLGGLNYFPYEPGPVQESLGLAGVVRGETDALLPETIAAILRGTEAPIMGMGDNASGHFPRILDDYPDPAFHLLPMDRYFDILAEAQRQNLVPEYHDGERILPYMSSRGCPYACVFCTQQILDLAWRGYSSDRLCAAMVHLKDTYGAERILFLDDLMNLDGPRFKVFAKHMADIGLPWDAVNGFRADRLNSEVLVDMARAGNRKVTVSAESADQDVLDRIVRKGMEATDIDHVAEITGALDYPCQIHYVIGFPGESRVNINTTLLHAARMRQDHGAVPLVQYATPVRGTRLFRLLEAGDGWAHPEDRDRDLSDLFYADSVIKDDEFDPEILKVMREGFNQSMRELDAFPSVLSLEDASGQWKERDELISEARGYPLFRRRVLLQAKTPQEYPGIESLVQRLGTEGVRFLGFIADAASWASPPTLPPGLRWLILDFRGAVPGEEFSEVIPSVGDVRVSALVSSHQIPLNDGLRANLEAGDLYSVEVVVAEDEARASEVEGAQELSHQLDALTAGPNTRIRVHGFAPCTLDKERAANALSFEGSGSHWKLIPWASGHPLGQNQTRKQIDACPSCLWRVGCTGLPSV